MISPEQFQAAWRSCGVLGREDTLAEAQRSIALGVSRQFVGDPGIGKTTIANELSARLRVHLNCDDAGQNCDVVVPIATRSLAFHLDIDFYYALICRIYNEHRKIDAPHAYVALTSVIRQASLHSRVKIDQGASLIPTTFYGDDLRWAAPDIFSSYLGILAEGYGLVLIFDQIELARSEFFDDRPKYYSLLDSTVSQLSGSSGHRVSFITFDTQHWRQFARGLTIQDTADLKSLEGHVSYLAPLIDEATIELVELVTKKLFPNGPHLTEAQLGFFVEVTGGYPRLLKDATELVCRWTSYATNWDKQRLEQALVDSCGDTVLRFRLTSSERNQLTQIASGNSVAHVLPELVERGLVKRSADGSFALLGSVFERCMAKSGHPSSG